MQQQQATYTYTAMIAAIKRKEITVTLRTVTMAKRNGNDNDRLSKGKQTNRQTDRQAVSLVAIVGLTRSEPYLYDDVTVDDDGNDFDNNCGISQ